jgi:hypothetical protein
MPQKRPYDPMFDPAGRLRCEQCAEHDESREGHETTKLLRLVLELAGDGATPEHPRGRAADVTEELRLRRPYYASYHARGHLSYAELDLEETPTDL